MSLFGKSAQELCNDAFAFEKQGKYNDAVESFKKAINDNPKYSKAYNGMAWAYAINNYELEEALNYANKAIAFADSLQNQANYIDTRAEIFLRLERFNEAIDDLKKCINLYGGIDKQDINYSASYRLAWCYLVTQNTSAAFSWINEALQLSPQNPFIYSTHGDICLNLEQYITAIDSYKKAIDKHSEWNFNYPVYGEIITPEQKNIVKSNLLISMGVAFYNIDDYNNCLICNKQSYELFKQPVSIINLASLAAKREDTASMRNLLEEGIALIDTQNHAHVINSLLTDPSLEKYRDLVLDLLKNHGKITPIIYTQHKKAWQEKKETKKNDAGLIITGGSVGTIVIGKSTKEGDKVSTFNINQDHQTVNGQQVIGDNNKVNYGVEKQLELRNELDKLKKQIEEAKNKNVIDEDMAEVATQNVEEAIKEASKSQPSSTNLITFLTKAKKFSGEAVPIVENIAKVVSVVKAIFLVP